MIGLVLWLLVQMRMIMKESKIILIEFRLGLFSLFGNLKKFVKQMSLSELPKSSNKFRKQLDMYDFSIYQNELDSLIFQNQEKIFDIVDQVLQIDVSRNSDNILDYENIKVKTPLVITKQILIDENYIPVKPPRIKLPRIYNYTLRSRSKPKENINIKSKKNDQKIKTNSVNQKINQIKSVKKSIIANISEPSRRSTRLSDIKDRYLPKDVKQPKSNSKPKTLRNKKKNSQTQ